MTCADLGKLAEREQDGGDEQEDRAPQRQVRPDDQRRCGYDQREFGGQSRPVGEPPPRARSEPESPEHGDDQRQQHREGDLRERGVGEPGARDRQYGEQRELVDEDGDLQEADVWRVRGGHV
jgi:hypothetical protein